MWIVKQKIENKRNLLKKKNYRYGRKDVKNTETFELLLDNQDTDQLRITN